MESTRTRGFPVALVVILLLVAAGAAAGGWWWYNNRTNPKDQAVKVMQTLKTLDWKAQYKLVALSPKLGQEAPNADAYATEAEKGFTRQPEVAGMVRTLFSSMENIAAGEPTITGNTATVPLTFNLSLMGQTVKFNGKAQMIKQGGIWKLDLTKATNERDTAKIMQELFGQPDMGNLPQGGRGMPGLGGNR